MSSTEETAMPSARDKRWLGYKGAELTRFVSIALAIALFITVDMMLYQGKDRTGHTTGVQLNQQEHIDFSLLPRHKVTAVSCQRLMSGDRHVIKKAQEYVSSLTDDDGPPDKSVAAMASNCSNLYARGYIMNSLTDEEANFPLAFSILVYNNISTMEHLLRALYRPQNLYCIHVDLDAKPDTHRAVEAIVRCFPNVWMASKLEDVVYAHYSRVQADLNCMDDALKRNSSWKYYINLAGSDLPMRTNAEMVAILKLYNGTNDIECSSPADTYDWLSSRVEYKWRIKKSKRNHKPTLVMTKFKKSPPPHGIRIIKGSAYGLFSRAFVDYLLHNETVQDFLEWSRDTYSPDEHIWASLHHVGQNPMLNTPGGYTGDKCHEKPWLAAYASWQGIGPCESKTWVHHCCIFNYEDLPYLTTRPEFMVNKFFPDRTLAISCLEEWLWNRTAKGLQPNFLDYYRVIYGMLLT